MVAKRTYTKDAWKHILQVGNLHAICVSAIRVQKCHLQTADVRIKKSNKYITGALHTQEFERLVGVIGMVFHLEEFGVDMDGDGLVFSTMPGAFFTYPSPTPC